MVCVCCTASFFFLGRNQSEQSISVLKQPSLPFPEPLFACTLNPLFSCKCEGLEVECAYKSNDKAPPVAETTGEADYPNVIAHVQAGSTSIVPQPRSRKQEGTMEAREIRGLQIATGSKITREGNVWIVPSQTGSKKYTVNIFIQTCTCPDFDAYGSKCKHMYAVEFIQQRESGAQLPIPGKIIRPTYKQNWPAYHRSQRNEKARGINVSTTSTDRGKQ